MEVFNNGPRSLLKNPHDCNVLDSRVFDNLIITDKLLSKTLHRFATCILVSNNLCRKLLRH